MKLTHVNTIFPIDPEDIEAQEEEREFSSLLRRNHWRKEHKNKPQQKQKQVKSYEDQIQYRR